MNDIDDQLLAARAQVLMLALGQRLGLNAAYHAFRRAAELEDRCDIVCSAAWQVLGRTIIVALSLSPSKTAKNRIAIGDPRFETNAAEADWQIAEIASRRAFFAAAPDLRLQARRIANNLEILVDAGRKGGSISSETVYRVARSLGGEISSMLATVDRLTGLDDAMWLDMTNR